MPIVDEYEKLIERIGAILRRRAGSMQQNGTPGAQHLIDAVDRVVADLLSKPASLAIANAAIHLDQRVLEPLILELKYINDNLPEPSQAWPRAQEDEAGGDAKTGKDSLEALLGPWLPQWLKQLLKVLNELIDLVL